MNTKWEMKRLHDLCQINMQSYTSKIGWEDVNYLDTGNITQNYISEIQHISIKDGDSLPSRARRMVKKGDIIFSTVRPNQKHYGFIDVVPWHFLISTGFSVLSISKDADARFIYYFLTQEKIIEHLQTIAEQATSTYPSIRPDDLMNLNVVFPPLMEQKKISLFLNSIDKKIELNAQINHNLEEQAKAIFKSWFVDFEPFQDGKFVDSELGRIPQGWKVGTLSELLLQRKESIQPGIYNWPYLPIDRIPMKSLGIVDFAPTEDAQSSLLAFHKNDIIIGAMRVYFHRVVLAPCQGITRTTCFTLYPKKDFWLEFCLLLCDADDTIDYAQSTSKGSTMPYAVWDGALANKNIIIPPDEILKDFSSITNPLIKKIRDAYKEQLALAQLRDSLLPKLMSGEIDVSEVEI